MRIVWERGATIMKALEAVVEILKLEGVELLFGYPMNNLIEAAAVGGIRPIIARTEKSPLEELRRRLPTEPRYLSCLVAER
ncbi:MAG: hypothetical protein EBT22_02675 [Chloroflexi bacterium]|nr:hypothetical protein [Chloroflexota bacterium]